MAGLLSNFRNTIILSLVLSLVMIGVYGAHWAENTGAGLDLIFWQAVTRWAHIVTGILWIGLLYYFNFVQIRMMPQVPAELKPGVTKYIAPEALFWFRYAALATVVFGLILGWQRGYLGDALALGLTSGNEANTLIGVGMWLAIIMAINVWIFIWPNQKVALGIGVNADADAKAKAGKTAMLFSRTNLLLSLPMLVSMGMHQTITAGG
jgi:uncharacterized membrane protein